MANQLDLNEEEMQQYEDMINDLAEKLERAEEERDEQVATNTALGERLLRVSEEKDAAFAAASAAWEQEKEALLESLADLEERSDEDKKELQSEVDKLASLCDDEAKARDELTAQLLAAQAELEASVSEMQAVKQALEQSEALNDDAKKQLAAAQEAAAALGVTQQAEVKRLREQVAAQREAQGEREREVSALREQLLAAAAAPRAPSPAEDAARQALETQLESLAAERDELASTVALSDDEIKAWAARFDGETQRAASAERQLQDAVAEVGALRDELQSSTVQRAQGEGRIAELERLVSAAKAETEAAVAAADAAAATAAAALDAAAAAAAAVPPAAPTPTPKGRQRSDALETPNQASASDSAQSAGKAPRSLLKVYMANQLDLNEEEMQQYEDMINDLAEKLERAEEERDDALLATQSAEAACDEARDQCEKLQQDLADREAQLEQFSEAETTLRLKLQETADFVSQLQVEKDHLMERLVEAQLTADSKGEEYQILAAQTRAQTEELERTEQSLIEIRVQLDQTRQHQQQMIMPSAPPLPGPPPALPPPGDAQPNFSNADGSSFSMSAINFSAVPLQGDADADVNALMEQKDSQIRMQISQLENFQDMLSDQQRANVLLKEQRNKLKDVVDALKKTEAELLENAAALRGRDEFLSQRVAQLEASLRKEAEARISNAASLDEMQAALHEALSQPQPQLEMNSRDFSSPTKMSPRDSSGLGASTPGRLTQLESRVRELTNLLDAAERSRSELQQEHDRLIVRLNSKSQHLDDLVRETAGLKEDIDTRLGGVDDLKVRGMGSDAAVNAALLEKDAVIAHLKQALSAAEATLADTKMVLQDKSNDLEMRRQVQVSLEEVVATLREKDTATEAILLEFSSEREDLETQIDSLSAQLQEQCDLALSLQERLDEAEERQGGSSAEQQATNEVMEEYKSRCDALQDELVTVRTQLQSMHGDLTSNASILSTRLEQLVQEKIAAETQIRKQKQALLQKENELYTRGNAVEELSRAGEGAARIVSFYHAQMTSQAEMLERHVSGRLVEFESRVASLSGKLAVTAQLSFVQRSELAAEAPPLWTHMHDTMAGVDGGMDSQTFIDNSANETIRALQMQLQNESQSNAQLFERLAERLEDAERRAEEASIGGARMQAESMRNNAFLEGECARLKGLVDELRQGNANLLEDLKVAREEGDQVRALEHQLQEAQNDVAQLRQWAADQEAAYSERLATAASAAEIAGEEAGREIAQLRGDISAAQAQAAQLQERCNQLSESLASQSALAAQDQGELTTRASWLEAQVQHFSQSAEQLESQVRSLQEAATAAEEKARQSDESLQELRGEQQCMLQDWQRKAQEMALEGEEASKRVADLTHALANARSAQQAAEEAAFEKDTAAAAHAAKLAEHADEARRLRAQADLLQDQLGAAVGHNEEREVMLREAQREADSVRSQFEDFKALAHRQALARAAEAESALAQAQDEAQRLHSAVASAARDAQYYQESLAHAETKYSAAQSDFVSLRAKEAAMAERLASLSQESDYYRAQWEEAMATQQLQSREVASMRHTVQDKSAHVEKYETRVSQLERELSAARAKFQTLSSLDTELGAEARELASFVSIALRSESMAAADMFSSPTHAITGSTPPGSPDGLLPQATHALGALRGKLEALQSHHENLVVQLEVLRSEKQDLADKASRNEGQLRVAEGAREELDFHVQGLETQLVGVQDRVAAVTTERDRLLSSAADQANKARAVLHDLNGTLSDVSERAAAAVAAASQSASSSSAFSFSVAQTIPESSWQPVLPTAALSSDFSTSALLTTVCHETERLLSTLCSSLEGAISDSIASKFAAEKAEALLAEKERSFEASMDGGSFYSAAATQVGAGAGGAGALQRAEREVYQLRLTLSELNRHKIELENEARQSLDMNGDLRLALGEAETLCADLRGHVRSLQAERDRLEDDSASLQSALDQQRRRCSDAELTLEKQTADLGRLRGENESLERVRRSLEAELDRRAHGATNSQVNTSASGTALAAGVSSHDAERLLLALSSAFDAYASLPSPPQLQRDSSPLQRVDAAVKSLSLLGTWVRDDARSRRAVQDRAAMLESELRGARAALEERTAEVKKHSELAASAVTELKDKRREASTVGAELTRVTLEGERAKRELASAQAQLEDERRSKQRLQAEISGLAQEATKGKIDSDAQKSVIAKLQSQVQAGKERVSELEADVEHKSDLLRNSKANAVKLQLALEHLERSEAKERREKDAMETRKSEADVHKVALARLQARHAELEASSKASRDTVAALRETVTALERQLAEASREAEGAKRKQLSAESRGEFAAKENRTLESSLSALRGEMQVLRDKAADDYAARLRAESALETAKSSGSRDDAAERARSGPSAAVAVVSKQLQASEERCRALEEERSSLSAKLKATKSALEERESALAAEQHARRSLDEASARSASKIEALQREIASAREGASTLRQEGRRARTQVLDAVAQMREVVNVIRADASAAGTTLSTPEKSRPVSGADEAEGSRQSLLEALSISELSSALSALRDAIVYLRQSQKHAAGLQGTVRTLERERAALQTETEALRQRQDESSKRLGEEILSLQKRLAEANQAQHTSQVAAAGASGSTTIVEAALKKERGDKERAVKELEATKTALAVLRAEQAAKSSSQSSADSSLVASLEARVTDLSGQHARLQADLHAAAHHRRVLGSTVEKLEKQIKQLSDAAADAGAQIKSRGGRASPSEGANLDASSSSSAVGGRAGGKDKDKDKEELEALKRAASRYRARVAGLEEVVAAYRQGLMALYPDGACHVTLTSCCAAAAAAAAIFFPSLAPFSLASLTFRPSSPHMTKILKTTNEHEQAPLTPPRSLRFSLRRRPRGREPGSRGRWRSCSNPTRPRFTSSRFVPFLPFLPFSQAPPIPHPAADAADAAVERRLLTPLPLLSLFAISRLQNQVSDLLGRLRQANSFSAELSRRFEETLQQQFGGSSKSSSSSGGDALTKQLDFLSSSLKKAQLQASDAALQLHHEQESGRRRHAQLLEHIKELVGRASASAVGSVGAASVGFSDDGPASTSAVFAAGSSLFASPAPSRRLSASSPPAGAGSGMGAEGLVGSAFVPVGAMHQHQQNQLLPPPSSYRLQPVNPLTTSSAAGPIQAQMQASAGGSFRVRRAGDAAAGAGPGSGRPPSPASFRGAPAAPLSELAARLKSPR